MIKDMRNLLQRAHPPPFEDLCSEPADSRCLDQLGAEEDPEYLAKLFKPWTEDTVVGNVFSNATTAFREQCVVASSLQVCSVSGVPLEGLTFGCRQISQCKQPHLLGH